MTGRYRPGPRNEADFPLKAAPRMPRPERIVRAEERRHVIEQIRERIRGYPYARTHTDIDRILDDLSTPEQDA